jgi:chromosome partitioning protein
MEDRVMTERISPTPQIIVLGNEKGGTGKSTIGIHLIIYLLRLGFKVGTIDVDARQGTLSSYLANRQAYSQTKGINLPCPSHYAVQNSTLDIRQAAREAEKQAFEDTLANLDTCDIIVIDTPGNDTYLSQLAHSYADKLITPMNDSFVDLDVLVKVNTLGDKMMKPSSYAETVWEQKKQRLMRDKATVDWIVVRNRLSNLSAKNKEEMWKMLQLISGRLGFRLVHGFTERVIFRELFLKGLTLLDLDAIGAAFSLSHVAARQELRTLMQALKLPDLDQRLAETG